MNKTFNYYLFYVSFVLQKGHFIIREKILGIVEARKIEKKLRFHNMVLFIINCSENIYLTTYSLMNVQKVKLVFFGELK